MMRWWHAGRGIWRRLRALGRAAFVLRVPLLTAVIGVAVLGTDQMREVIAVAADDSSAAGVFNHLTFGLVATFLAAFTLWFVGRWFSLVAAPQPPRDVPDWPAARDGWFLVLVPVATATGYLAYVLLLFRSGLSSAGQAGTALGLLLLVVLAAAAILLVATLLLIVGGILFEPQEVAAIDRYPTRWFFTGDDDETSVREVDSGDVVSVYLWMLDAVRQFLRRHAGRIHAGTFVARTYGLERTRSIRSLTGGVPPSARTPTVVTVPRASTPGWRSSIGGSARLDPRAVFVARNPGSRVQQGDWAGQWQLWRQAVGPLQTQFVGLAVAMSIIVPMVLAVSVVMFFVQAAAWPEWIGAVAIVQIFVVALLAVLTFLYRRSDVVIAIVAASIIVAAADVNDIHHIRPLPGAPASQSTLADGFSRWLDARQDRAAFDRYPVYVVAARGGGIYAGYHAAVALARMEDECPGFAQHLFAISSVSGGSLGSSVFAALASTQASNTTHSGCGVFRATTSDRGGHRGPFEERARAILSHDFLSSVVSATLFPDLAMQVLPACLTDRGPLPLCLKGFDRARALERAFEAAWISASVSAFDRSAVNPLADSFYRLWSASGAAPALLMNTTDVETGGRVVIAPFETFADSASIDGAPRPVMTLLGVDPVLDLRLSTAAGISARFPVVTPAAWFRAREAGGPGRKVRLVDGGYFDNSGIATALDGIDVMTAVADRKGMPVDIRLIVLTGAPEPIESAYSFGEAMSVVRALLNTREEHGRRIEELARSRMRGQGPGAHVSMTYLVLDTGDYALPLGWQLSERSRQAIDATLGEPASAEACAAMMTPGSAAGVRVNSCTMALIRRDLQ